METVTEKEPRFKTYSDIVKDEFFIESIKKHTDKLFLDRRNRKPAGKGRRYKRDWYDTMQNAGDQLSGRFFLENILEIWHKTSQLSANTRKVIQFVGGKAVHDTLFHYDKLDNESNDSSQ